MRLPWRLPVMQAPLGPAATTDLVAAVSAGGALGTLAASWTPLRELREQVRWLRSHCSEPFCVNLVLAFDQRERLRAVLDEGAPIVSFSWGVDSDLLLAAKDAGAYVLVQAGTLAGARAAAAAGANAVIVQGMEAGGHVQSRSPLLELLPEIRRALKTPILAAGGIADARGRDRALEGGADGVVCGTVFLAAHEADVHPIYLQHLIEADAADTAVTTLFDGGWPDAPHRVLENETLTAWKNAGSPERGRRPGEGDRVASRKGQPVVRYDDAQPTRDTDGEIRLMAMYAGTSVQAIARAEPAARILERLTTDL